MVDDSTLGQIFSVFTVPAAAWTTACAFIIYLFRIRNERLRDVEKEKNDGWGHLNDLVASLSKEVTRLSERLKAVEIENEECRKSLSAVRDELAVERAERIKFELILQGEGDMRQEAQRIISADRQEPKPRGQR